MWAPRPRGGRVVLPVGRAGVGVQPNSLGAPWGWTHDRVHTRAMGPHHTVAGRRGSVRGVSGRLHELDEDAAGVLGVDEVHPRAARAAPRLLVQEAQAALAQRRAHGVDVLDA